MSETINEAELEVRRCQPEKLVAFVYTAGLVLAMLWKSPNDANGHLYLKKARELAGELAAQLAELRLRRDVETELESIVARIVGEVDRLVGEVGDGPVTPDNSAATASRVEGLLAEIPPLLARGCR